MSKSRKKFSFFKFLLVMGALIALAVFLLDKFLPKPYRDDELEDAWAGDDLEPAEPEPSAAPASSGAESEQDEGSGGEGEEEEGDEDKS